jgi:hypothetical protein
MLRLRGCMCSQKRERKSGFQQHRVFVAKGHKRASKSRHLLQPLVMAPVERARPWNATIRRPAAMKAGPRVPKNATGIRRVGFHDSRAYRRQRPDYTAQRSRRGRISDPRTARRIERCLVWSEINPRRCATTMWENKSHDLSARSEGRGGLPSHLILSAPELH